MFIINVSYEQQGHPKPCFFSIPNLRKPRLELPPQLKNENKREQSMKP